MTKVIAVLVLAAALLTGCTSRTPYGPCIGVGEEEDPTLRYKISVQNAVVAALFSSTIVVPAVVIFDELRCPVGKR